MAICVCEGLCKLMLLCVDDEPIGLEVRKAVLERLGYEVVTASSGQEALQAFAANPVTAAVLDFSMPDMNGGQVAAELKRLNPELKIMMLSGDLDLPTEVTNLVDICAVKGTSPTALLFGVQQLMFFTTENLQL